MLDKALTGTLSIGGLLANTSLTRSLPSSSILSLGFLMPVILFLLFVFFKTCERDLLFFGFLFNFFHLVRFLVRLYKILVLREHSFHAILNFILTRTTKLAKSRSDFRNIIFKNANTLLLISDPSLLVNIRT